MSFKNKKSIYVGVLVLALIAAGFYVFTNSSGVKKEKEAVISTDNWQTYDIGKGFSFKYPNGWELVDTGTYGGTLIIEKDRGEALLVDVGKQVSNKFAPEGAGLEKQLDYIYKDTPKTPIVYNGNRGFEITPYGERHFILKNGDTLTFVYGVGALRGWHDTQNAKHLAELEKVLGTLTIK